MYDRRMTFFGKGHSPFVFYFLCYKDIHIVRNARKGYNSIIYSLFYKAEIEGAMINE